MKIDTTITTDSGIRVSVSEWDEGCIWMHLQYRNGSSHFVMTAQEAEQLAANLLETLKENQS
jgi:hypothetical protein